jgi:gamma-glutamyltranspeptidase/glutathione hydrolase
MGGHMQPQGHVQVVMSTVDDGLDPQAALDAPRWYWHAGRSLHVEPTMDAALVGSLQSRGHEVTVEDIHYGYGQAIWRLPDGAGYVAGSEPRADGCASGY